MAEYSYADNAPNSRATFVNWAGAGLSVALILGLVVWGWELMVRDVSGVPVIQALEGPMRIEPDNPGGLEADHQGLAVNRIAEGQEAAPAADEIVLAPPPVELAELEGGPVNTPPVPVEPLASEAPSEPTEGTQAPETRVETRPETSPQPRPSGLPQVTLARQPVATAPTPEAAASATLALIDELIEADAAPALETGATTLQAASGENRVISVSIPGVRRSLIPKPRPSEAAAEAAVTVAPAQSDAPSSEPVQAELAFDSLTPGTWLAQLGEFDDAEGARAFWASLSASFPDYFDARARVVQETVAGGTAFYRLRAHGFEDLMDARRFCTALLAEGHNRCIPVAVR